MDAIFIANYIIDYTNKINRLINNMKLQKLLYYAYSAVLIETDEELFDDPIEKWHLGPIIPHVYYEFKDLGTRPIIKDYILNVKLESSESKPLGIAFIPYDEEAIPHTHKEIIRRVIDHLINYNPLELVGITIKEAIYTKDEETINKRGRKPPIQYTNDEILEQYTNHPETAIWLTEKPINHAIPKQNIDSISKQYAIIQCSNDKWFMFDDSLNRINQLELLSVHDHFEKAYYEAFERFINRISANCQNDNTNSINLLKDYQQLNLNSTKHEITVNETNDEYQTYIHIDLKQETINLKINDSNNSRFELKVQPLPETKS